MLPLGTDDLPPVVESGMEAALARWTGSVGVAQTTYILHGTHDIVYPMPSRETCKSARCFVLQAGHGLLLTHANATRSWVKNVMDCIETDS